MLRIEDRSKLSWIINGLVLFCPWQEYDPDDWPPKYIINGTNIIEFLASENMVSRCWSKHALAIIDKNICGTWLHTLRIIDVLLLWWWWWLGSLHHWGEHQGATCFVNYKLFMLPLKNRMTMNIFLFVFFPPFPRHVSRLGQIGLRS